jgi:tetratricopeptide (TPR) repeat protein
VGRQAMADRYAYLPFIGLFIMVCWGVADCVVTTSRWLASRRGAPTVRSASPAPTRISTVLLAAICVGVLVALALVTHRQIDYWGDNVTLWSHTLQVTSHNYEAEEDLGEALLAKGEQVDAMPHFYRAIEIDPRRPLPHMYIAVYDQEHGNLQDAIAQYRKVLSVSQNTSTNAPALANMGHAYLQLGNMAQARESLQAAVALDPHKMETWMDLGLAKQKSGDLAGAALAYSEGVKVKPSDVGYLLLARALEQSSRSDEAAAAMQRAKALSTNFAKAQEIANQMLAQ